MNEQANIDLVRQCYDAFQKGDIQAILGHLDPEVDWQLTETEGLAFTGKRHGLDQVAGFFRQVDELMALRSFEPREFIARGHRVVVLGHYDWVVRQSGAGFGSDWVQVFSVADGKITQFEEYSDTARLADAFGVAGMRAAHEAMMQEAGHAAPQIH